jgi:RNA polymerase sigma factor (sigma-70 family)
VTAFDELYKRHRQAAAYVARRECDNPSDVDDVVAEAFLAVFEALKCGKGPTAYFRSYVLTTTRRMAHQRNLAARRRADLDRDRALEQATTDPDAFFARFESATLMRAFRSLPPRWQRVLWCVDIEGMKHTEAGEYVGVNPNGVASLLIRAREGLRQAYLQAHVREPGAKVCSEVSQLFGRLARNSSTVSARKRAESHLAACPRCTEAMTELREIQSTMKPPSLQRSAGPARNSR